jgi:hypothetical protein
VELSLKPPVSIQKKDESASLTVRARRLSLDDAKRAQIEGEIKRIVDAWKTGTSHLHERLRQVNDHLEGVTEDVTFPWSGASSVTVGLAAGMGRTLHAVFDRAVFPDQRPFAVKAKDNADKEKRNKLEAAVNWLAQEHNNLVDELRDMPWKIWRDGTAPIMGEWERKVEKACDYKVYQTPESFKQDYPDAETAGIPQKKFDEVLEYLSMLDASVSVEYVYDAVVRDAPRFTGFPLARLVWYPLSSEGLEECVLYGRQLLETVTEAKIKVKRGQYDEEPTKQAIAQATGNGESDSWGLSRESIEGISRANEDVKRLEAYKLVVKMDLDNDDIPEKYSLTYEHRSGKILRIERYRLRKNIDNLVVFRFTRRDGRMLGKSMVDDGLDQFRMIDNLHRHRQNVRAITDCPAFLCPESLKEQVDFGGDDGMVKPGVTYYINDAFMGNGKAPRQLEIMDPSKTGESIDEENMLVRYLEFRLGPSQGLSGQESNIDPSAPATKTIAQLKQANMRIDDFIREWKRSVPAILELHNALYYQYGLDKMSYGDIGDDGDIQFDDVERDLFALDNTGFILKHSEIALSPEFEMEKVMGLASIAAQSPIILQARPQIALELWNDLVDASRRADPARFKVPLPPPGAPAAPGDPAAAGQPGQPGPSGVDINAILRGGNQAPEGNPGAPTPNQQHAAAIARPLAAPRGGGMNGNR